ncbi:MAG: ATP-binding cassette domain-containing protein, partial [Acidimicrobiales bacterium]
MTTLQARDLSVAFDGVHALDGIDIDVESGQVLAAIGANGAGKSTLLNVLSGLTVPDRGEVWVDGTRLEPRPSVFADAGVRRSYQHLRLVDRLSIDENIALGLCGSLPRVVGIPLSRRRATREAVAAARRKVGIDDLRDRPVGQLSYGQRKRVELARVLVS